MRPLDKIGEDVRLAEQLAKRLAGAEPTADGMRDKFEADQLRSRLVIDALEMHGELTRLIDHVKTLVIISPVGKLLRSWVEQQGNADDERAMDEIDKAIGYYIVCGPCSKAGGAGLPVWHTAPACPEEP